MGEPVPSPELEEHIRQVLGGGPPRPEFVRALERDLRARAAALAARPTRGGRRLAWRWALALVILIALGVLAIGPANLAAAMQRLLGYIPGVGLVDESTGLRVLEAPVRLERDGITLTVEQAVADGERTIVVFKVDGIPPQARPRAEDAPACHQNPQLVLPDGEGMAIRSASGGGDGRGGEAIWRGDMVSGGGQGWGSGYSWRMVFAALPPDVDRVTLHVPCLFETAPGMAPEDWRLDLRLIPAPADQTIVPVLQVRPSAVPTAGGMEAEASGMVLEQVIELDDRYILIGAFHQGSAIAEGTVLGLPPTVEITVADGEPWPWEFAQDIDLPAREPGTIPWAYEIPKGFTTPITVRIPAVDVEIPVEAYLQLAASPGLGIGERTPLDERLNLGGHEVRLVGLLRAERGYELEFESDASVSGITAVAVDPVAGGGWGGGTGGAFVVGFDYGSTVPSGLLRFRITGLTVSVPGPWSVSWSPPAGAPSVPAPAPPTPCLTLDRWRQITAQAPGQSPGLWGKVIAEEGNMVFVVDLRTGERRDIGAGNWPDLSSDGRLAAYSGTGDGLHVVDLATGEAWIVPGTTANDYGPRWSPDGAWLAFRRIDDLNLYRVRPDGSGLQRLTEGPEYELLIDWTSDGAGLYYGFPSAGGVSLRLLDLAAGTARSLFDIDAKDAWAAVSPDGQRIAYVARVPGGIDYGLYLARLDGTARRVLVHLDHWGVMHPAWSSDGRWLMVTVVNTDAMQAETAPALLRVDTCEVIPGADLGGSVWDWVP